MLKNGNTFCLEFGNTGINTYDEICAGMLVTESAT